MVLIKSTLIAQASGSLAGATFSRNKGGAYMRARVRGTNPNTLLQSRARSSLSRFASAFAGLTAAQRATWEQYAEEAVHVNALGDAITQTGISLYIASNTLLELGGLSPVDVAPVGTTRPSSTLTFNAVATYDVSSVAFSLSEVAVENAGSGGTLILQSSPTLTPGQQSFKQRYRTAAFFDGSVTPVSTATGAYAYAAGSQFACRLRYIRNDGAFSEPYFVRGTAVA